MTTARTHAFSVYIRAVGDCVGSHAVCPADGSTAESDDDDDDNNIQDEDVSVDNGDDMRPSTTFASQELCH